VLIDLDRMERNIAAMQAYCDRLGVRLRPHIKTHKIPAIARMQLEAGAVGLACQKTTEAEVFADAGFDDIQIPYNVIGPQKTARLARLAGRIAMTAAADHPAVVAGLGDAAEAAGVTLNVLADLATDLERTGASVDGVIALAKRIDAHPCLRFAGILVYPSRVLMRPAVQETLARLAEAGIPCETVSGGGTPASAEAGGFPELTELRVGTYVFNDWTTVQAGRATLDECAMRVAATVVSTPTPERAILDSGSKTLSSDHLSGRYGRILEYPEARIYRLNEEHAYVDVSACPARPSLGERVHVIPVHTCVVTNLHDQLFGVRGENVELAWPVAARGKVW
jgi:D-serine deaminase-like pyridoxal phosphate-dependent protein